MSAASRTKWKATCPRCDFDPATLRDLERHLNTEHRGDRAFHHSTTKPRRRRGRAGVVVVRVCPYCAWVATSKRAMVSHVQAHGGVVDPPVAADDFFAAAAKPAKLTRTKPRGGTSAGGKGGGKRGAKAPRTPRGTKRKRQVAPSMVEDVGIGAGAGAGMGMEVAVGVRSPGGAGMFPETPFGAGLCMVEGPVSGVCGVMLRCGVVWRGVVWDCVA